MNIPTNANDLHIIETTDSINVVFLDIDGVLLKNSSAHKNQKAFEENLSFIQEKLGTQSEELSLYDIGATLLFVKEAIENLKTLCDKTNAKIVISSNWRINGEHRKKESLIKLKGLFKLHDLNSLIIDQTPSLLESRSVEIKAWLDNTMHKVANFVILDDVDSGLSEQYPKNFIYTGDTCLLTRKHLVKALSVFDKSVPGL